jgi:hypothetical protein
LELAGHPVDDPLPEEHARYFSGLDDAVVVAVDTLSASVPARAQPDAVVEARRRMREAAQGARPRRAPLDVRRDGSKLVVIDGNATYAVVVQEGWHTVPVRIRS